MNDYDDSLWLLLLGIVTIVLACVGLTTLIVAASKIVERCA